MVFEKFTRVLLVWLFAALVLVSAACTRESAQREVTQRPSQGASGTAADTATHPKPEARGEGTAIQPESTEWTDAVGNAEIQPAFEKGQKGILYEELAVRVRNLEPIAGKIFDSECVIGEDAIVTYKGEDEYDVLVRYRSGGKQPRTETSKNEESQSELEESDSPCPPGTLFFVSPDQFQAMTDLFQINEEEARQGFAEREKEKKRVGKILEK